MEALAIWLAALWLGIKIDDASKRIADAMNDGIEDDEDPIPYRITEAGRKAVEGGNGL